MYSCEICNLTGHVVLTAWLIALNNISHTLQYYLLHCNNQSHDFGLPVLSQWPNIVLLELNNNKMF